MTNEELERAVERLNGDLLYAGDEPTAVTRTPDLRALLSERAELLAAVKRMRGEMAALLEGVAYHEGHDGRPSYLLRPSFAAAHQHARAALTTGESQPQGQAMTDTVRVPKAFSDWLYGVEGYGLRVERLSEELRDPVDKLLPWLLAAFEVGLAASPQGQGSSADDIGHELIAFANQIEGASHDARAAAVQFFSERIARRVTEGVKPQPDALPGDLRETVARRMFDADSKENGLARDWMFEGGCHASYFAMADAILSLIQSERGGA